MEPKTEAELTLEIDRLKAALRILPHDAMERKAIHARLFTLTARRLSLTIERTYIPGE